MSKNYSNLSADDAVKLLFRRINFLRAAVLVILGIAYLYLVYLVFTSENMPAGATVIFLILCALAAILRTAFEFRELAKINRIINRDCDPVTYADIFLILRTKRLFKKRIASATLSIAQGYLFSGRFEDAYNTLSELKTVPRQVAFALWYYSLLANCGSTLERPELITQAKTSVESIAAKLNPKFANAQNAWLIMNIIDASLAYRDKRYDEALELLNAYQATVKEPSQKVSAAYLFAKIYFETGDYQNAKGHLEFIIQNGNKLYFVERAKEMLPKCTE